MAQRRREFPPRGERHGLLPGEALAGMPHCRGRPLVESVELAAQRGPIVRHSPPVSALPAAAVVPVRASREADCAADQASVHVPKGLRFTTQKEWE